MNGIIVTNKSKVGDCEAFGEHTNRKVTLDHGMWLCEECYNKEREAEKRAAETEARNKQNDDVMRKFRTISQTINTPADIAISSPVPIIELKAAIEQNESIPATEKQKVFVDECARHVDQLMQAMSDTRKLLEIQAAEIRMWQTNGQSVAATLRAEYRDQYKQFNINYSVTSPKVAKPKATPKPTAKRHKYDVTAGRAAATKYGVSVDGIQLIVAQRNITEEEAALVLVAIRNKKLSQN